MAKLISKQTLVIEQAAAGNDIYRIARTLSISMRQVIRYLMTAEVERVKKPAKPKPKRYV